MSLFRGLQLTLVGVLGLSIDLKSLNVRSSGGLLERVVQGGDFGIDVGNVGLELSNVSEDSGDASSEDN